MSDANENITVSRSHGKHCKKCNRVDSFDDMVCCDACESWEHFECAGVSASISDRSWKCSGCLANWDGASKISFNESSVSKSSRVSQRLQLSLQLLEEQRTLKKKRAEEETRIRKQEEDAKRKEMEDEQEYLRQKYELLMQVEAEKDSTSRRSGVSVKSRRERMEKWLTKNAQGSGIGQSQLLTSGQKATMLVSAVSQENSGVIVPPSITVSSSVAASTNPVFSNLDILYPDHLIPVPDGNVPTLAKSFESLVVSTMPGSKSVAAVPVTVLATASGSLITTPMVSSSVCASVPALPVVHRSTITGIQNPPMSLGTAPVYSYPGGNALVSSAPEMIPSNVYGSSGLYGNPLQYLPQTSIGTTSPLPIPLSTHAAPKVSRNPAPFPCPPTIATFPVTMPEVMQRPTSVGIGEIRNNPSVSLVGPTSAQLAARQVMPRELPKFNGDPEDWPIFYSSLRNTTEVCGYTDAENLARLQRSLGGSALDAVRSRLLLPASVPYVMATLHKLFGRPEILISSLLKKVRNVPPPKADNLNTIVTYGLVIQNLVDHIILADQQAHLSNPMLLQELIDKLPTSLKMQWGTFKQAFVHINLATFNSFMSGLVDLASELSIGVDSAQNHHKQHKVEKAKQKEKLFTHANESPAASKTENARGEPSSKACSYCEKDSHQILNCFSFKSLDIGDRWKAMRQKNLCRLCLIPHRKWPCRSKKECGVDGCRVRHHMLLHSSRNDANESAKSSETVHNNHHHTKSYSLFRYLPVTLYGDGKQVETFVFLDDGSSATLLEEGIAAQLGIKGEPDNLLLSWTGKISRHEKTSKRLSVKISGASKKEMFQLGNVRTVRELGLPNQTLDYKEPAKTFPHLQGLPVSSYVNAKPGMIVGLEHVKLLTSLKTREGSSSEPVATKSRLGWCVYGRNSGNEGSIEQLHVHAYKDISNSDLYDSMRKFFAVEDAVVTRHLVSEEDKRARDILEATTVRKGARMETGLLWRMDDVKFPASYAMAVNRLRGLEKRLTKDPELRRRVNEQIESYETKQYVRKVSPEELENANPQRVWYLPLGVVTNPKKPNKIRMVWDAAAKAGGVSFNDMLLKGPDLLVSLVEVLIRFREGKYAICSDIREMFLRILIREADKWSQCFLWRFSPQEEIQVYIINVAMFGATSSPCTAQFVKNKNALDYTELYPRAVEAILKNHYVDDFLDSVNSVEEAVQLVTQVQLIHAAAGFEFGKILSNSQEVLDRLGETGSPNSKPLILEKESIYERVLGMVWVPREDHFTFDRTGLEEVLSNSGAVPTKRQVLRTVMKLYDPLGFVAHFVVQGKIVMQEIWRTGTNWDEPIAEELHDLWSRWIKLYETIDG